MRRPYDLGQWAPRASAAGADVVGDFLADHDGGGVGVGTDAVGHDGCVGDAEVFETVDASVLVDDGHFVVGGAHLAGPGYMVVGAGVALERIADGGVRGDFRVDGVGAVEQEFVAGRMLADFDAGADGFTHSLQVEWFLVVLVVQIRVFERAVGFEGEFALAWGQSMPCQPSRESWSFSILRKKGSTLV